MVDTFRIIEKRREKQLIKDRPWIAFPEKNDTKLMRKLAYSAIRSIPLAKELKNKADTRWKIYDALQGVTRIPFRLYMVGSCTNFTGLKNCDLDLALIFEKDQTREQIKSFLDHLINTLETTCSRFQNFEIVLANVPILKFLDTQMNSRIDLNVNGRNSVRNSALIRTYLALDPRARPLVMVIKKMARDHEINDAAKGGLSSYCLTLMVIFYLQRRKVLPILPETYISVDMENPLYFHHNYERYESDNRENLEDLFRGFLEYYALEFDFRADAISVRIGKPKRKYKAKFYAINGNEPKDWNILCVEEPFLRINASKSVQTDKEFKKIIYTFGEAIEKIKAGYYEP